jgi:3-hydroxyisobutyrate dehydrogenase-like beta-hydroxyacid dehydrogenase
MTRITDVGAVRVALIGYGEVGQILGAELSARGVARVRAFDILFGDPQRGVPLRERAQHDKVELTASAGAAVEDAHLVIAAVTADRTRDAALSVAGALRNGAFYVDVNSASPGTKSNCAAAVNGAGARYVEMAVMTSVPPHGIRTPMLAGGPHAAAVLPLLEALGFRVQHSSDRYGVASATKMCRSVIIKGMEALVIESFLAARRYGVEQEVLASLAETFPGMDWERNGDHFWSRVVQHGRRRAEEMREAAATVREAGIEPLMTRSIADRQAWLAALAQAGVFADLSKDASWRDFADRVQARHDAT